jgi:hypothetical protein
MTVVDREANMLGAGTDTHPVLACAAEIGQSLKSVATVDPGFMTTAERREALLALDQLGDQVTALKLRVVAESDDVAEVDGSRTMADWLATRSRRDRAECARTQRLAAALAQRPLMASGLTDGTVNLSQATVIVRALDQLGPDVRPELVARAEEVLVGYCGEFGPKVLKRFGDRVLELIEPEVYEDQERQRLEQELKRAERETSLSLRDRGDGTCDLQARLPGAVGKRLKTYLEAFTSPRHHHSDPGIGLIDTATGAKIPHDRLLGEAFCSLLESIDPNKLPLHGGTPTQVIVTMDYEHLAKGVGVGTLEDGTPITVGQVRRLACNAQIVPAVLGGDSEVLDLGRARRLFSGAQHKALGIKHRECQAEGCTIPATWCEAHHATNPWSRGGKTNLADGQLLCNWHHHRAHDESYTVKTLPNGQVRFHKRT